MHHGVLGCGGIGGLIGGALALAGHRVDFVVRPGTLSSYPDHLSLDSSELGVFDIPATFSESLQRGVDVLWVTLKNQHLREALDRLDRRLLRGSVVVPLMNGVDHVKRLRDELDGAEVIAGSIRTESTRVAPGRIVHRGWHVVPASASPSPFPRPTKPVHLSVSETPQRVNAIVAELGDAGVPSEAWDSEGYLLWNKLAVVCPYALATTAVAGPIGAVRSEPETDRLLRACAVEVLDVAGALGVELDRDEVLLMLDRFPAGMRVSMERDASRGVPIEIDAISLPVIEHGQRHGIAVDATTELRQRALASAERLAHAVTASR